MCPQVACALWLALLFRALGSTAESFFSPILTQLSQEMGLPPRLAGGETPCSKALCMQLQYVVSSMHSWHVQSAPSMPCAYHAHSSSIVLV